MTSRSAESRAPVEGYETRISVAATRYVGKLSAVLLILTLVSFALQLVSERINGRWEWLEFLIDDVVLGIALYLFARFFVGTARRTESSVINRAISILLGDISSAATAAWVRVVFFLGFVVAAVWCLYVASPLTWFALSGDDGTHGASWLRPVESHRTLSWMANTLIWVCFQVLFANLLLQACWQFGTIWSDGTATLLLRKNAWRFVAEESACKEDLMPGQVFGVPHETPVASESARQSTAAIGEVAAAAPGKQAPGSPVASAPTSKSTAAEADAAASERTKKAPQPLRVVHWSDLHILCGDGRIEDQEASGDRAEPQSRSPDDVFEECLKRVAESVNDVDVLLITGDVTDTGSERQWAFFLEMLIRHPVLRNRVVVLPGNHDTNINCSDARVIDRRGIGRALKLRRLLRTVAEIHADRAEVFDSDQGLVPLQRYVHQQIAAIDALPKGSDAYADRVREAWDGLYPMVFRLEQGIAIICLDSVGPSSHLLSNAFGRVDSEALTRLAALQVMLFSVGYSCVYAMHHQLLWPQDLTAMAKTHSGLREKVFRRFQSRFMVVEDAPKLLSLLDAGSRTTVMFHGHKHIGYVRKVGANLLVASAASTTYGDETGRSGTDGEGRFRLFTLMSKPDGGVVASWRMVDPNTVDVPAIGQRDVAMSRAR